MVLGGMVMLGDGPSVSSVTLEKRNVRAARLAGVEGFRVTGHPWLAGH